MPKRHNVAGNSPWETRVGYSRAVRIGSHVWVAGTTATDDAGRIVGPGDAEAQARQALENIRQALGQVGAGPEDVVRTRMYVTRMQDQQAVGRVHAEIFGAVRPAATMVEVSALADPAMLVEIEVEAFVDR